jgi:hypothetical protein
LAIETSPGDNILEYWKQRDSERPKAESVGP